MPQNRPHKKQISDDTRRIIVNKYELGMTYRDISILFDVPYETVRSIVKLFIKTGRIRTIKQRQPKIKKLSIEEEAFLKNKIAEDVSVTLKKLKSSLLAEKGIAVSIPTIAREIKNFNYSLKRVVLVPSMRNSAENIEARFNYANEYLLLNEEKIIFLDEFGVSCSHRLSYGRSEVGTPAKKVVRSIRSKNFSICAAISKNGLILSKTMNTAYNGALFSEFVQELMVKLNELQMMSFTIIMDNVSFHKVTGINELIFEGGHNLLFLPTYSPQLNPIEEFFSKWKQSVRSANSNTVTELENAISIGCSLITRLTVLVFLLMLEDGL